MRTTKEIKHFHTIKDQQQYQNCRKKRVRKGRGGREGGEKDREGERETERDRERERGREGERETDRVSCTTLSRLQLKHD